MNTAVNEDLGKMHLKDSSSTLLIPAVFFVLGIYLIFILSIILTLGVGFGIIALIYYLTAHFLHRIPVGIMLMLALGALYGAYALLKGIVVSIRHKPGFEPALLINKDKHPKLLSFIQDLCEKMDTKVPDSIILHAEPTFFVQQGKLNVFNGMAKGRILAIGVPALSFLTINELRAILVHEFAHFTGKDTIYSASVLPVYTSTITSIRTMRSIISSGSDNSTWMSIPLILPTIILGAYLNKFHTTNMERSRDREKRADIIAASLCGSLSFANALKKVVGLSRTFDNSSINQIVDLLKEGRAYTNYYDVLRTMAPQIENEVNEYEKSALSETESENSSHPSLKTRLEYIPEVEEKYNDLESPVDLILNFQKCEESLTENYTQYVSLITNTGRN